MILDRYILTETQHNELLKLFKNEICSMEHLVTGHRPIRLLTKEDSNQICSRPYPVPKVNEEMF